LTNGLLISAALMGGLLAGLAVNKVLVQIPAWAEVGVIPWASFMRAADLARGFILYPLIGLTALVLTTAAAVTFHVDRTAPSSAAVPIYLASGLAITALIVTTSMLAQPTLSLREIGDNTAELQRIFSLTARWWEIKALLHVLTFASNLWALAIILPATRHR
jgi:hypothetical protein